MDIDSIVKRNLNYLYKTFYKKNSNGDFILKDLKTQVKLKPSINKLNDNLFALQTGLKKTNFKLKDCYSLLKYIEVYYKTYSDSKTTIEIFNKKLEKKMNISINLFPEIFKNIINQNFENIEKYLSCDNNEKSAKYNKNDLIRCILNIMSFMSNYNQNIDTKDNEVFINILDLIGKHSIEFYGEFITNYGNMIYNRVDNLNSQNKKKVDRKNIDVNLKSSANGLINNLNRYKKKVLECYNKIKVNKCINKTAANTSNKEKKTKNRIKKIFYSKQILEKKERLFKSAKNIDVNNLSSCRKENNIKSNLK